MNISSTEQLPPDSSEWVFSLCVPAGVRYKDDASEEEAAITLTTSRFIHLRQDDAGEASDDDDAYFAAQSADSKEEPSSDQDNANNNNNNNQERVSLLHPVDQANDNNTVGWTLHSPFWTLQARNLLTVTYGPAWQALPAYTNRSCSCCSRSSSCCTFCCGSSGNTPHRDFLSETFSCHDIVAIERLHQVYIAGAGECHGLRVQLRPLRGGDDLPDMPAQYQQAWREQLQNIQTNRQVLIRQQQTSQHTRSNNKNSHTPPILPGPVITFCLPKALPDPPLLWKVDLPALQDKAIAMESITVLDGALQTCSPSVQRMSSHSEKEDTSPTHIFINGFQSWSFAGSIVKGRSQPKSGLPNMFSRAFNYGGSPPPPADVVVYNSNNTNTTPPSGTGQQIHGKPCVYRSIWKQHYMSDFFTCITSDAPPKRRRYLRQVMAPPPPYQQLDETGGPALILGWLSQQEQFGVIEVDKDLEQFQMHASTHGQILLSNVDDDDKNNKYNSIRTDWAYAQLLHPHSYDEEPLVHYLHAAAAHGHARPLQNGPLLTGWCSWYVFYENINAELLRQNFGTLAQLKKTHVPTNVAVVDDGYMTAWGDWASLKPGAFPGDGLGQVSRDISQHGMRPGLWLAPFAADKHSQLTKDHADWVIKNDVGVAANSSNCGKFFHGLDATNPAVREHVFEAIRRAVVNWEYSVLKIDFLYAACLEGNGKFDLSMSRAQAMHLALKTIREAAGPDVFLIGCGCPISSGIGFVDAMRVSPDTGPTWYPAWPLPWWDHGTLPALRSMIRNSIARAPFGHRFWHNDPDCLMLGEHTQLTDEEVASAATVVAMTCGMLLLSDDLPKVKPKRMQIVSKIFPLTGVSAVVLDLHSTNDGLPSLMRLWCTDRFNLLDSFRESRDLDEELDLDNIVDHNAEATYFAQRAAFRRTEELLDPNERQRSCIHVTKGLGTWTVVSVSNWLDTAAVVHIPPMALITPPASAWDSRNRKSLSETSFLNKNSSQDDDTAHGYHVFAFWSGKYSWLPDQRRHDASASCGPSETLSKKLQAHETEIFHIKPVTPEQPQYIGSDLHFSCGKEVLRFRASTPSVVEIWLDTSHRRMGHIYLYIPRANTDNVKAVVNNNDQLARWEAVGNTPRVGDNGSPRLAGRVLRIQVMVHADGRPRDGQITVEY